MGLLVSKEQFGNPMNPERPPLANNSALRALYRAEAIDNYRQQVETSLLNRLARATAKYLPSLQAVKIGITPSDNWPNGQVIWMDPDSDNGLPHTRPPNYICIPSTLTGDELTKILEHERVHISQRLNPDSWKTAMEKWSMTPWTGTIPPEIFQNRRLNPDLLLSPTFQWKNEWVPLAIFSSISAPVLDEVDIVWWHTSTKTLHREAPPGWKDFFGTVDGGHEHPYELAAYFIENDTSTTEAYKVLKPIVNTLSPVKV
jgi:hypothetical protein